MKKILLAGAAALSLAAGASAQSYLIGGIGFEQLINDGFTYNVDFSAAFGSVGGLYSDTTLPGDSSNVFPTPYVSRATVFWDGSHLSSAWLGEDGLNSAGSVGGFQNNNSTGEAITTTRRLNVGDPSLYNKGLDTEGIYQFANPNTQIDRALGLNLASGNNLSFLIDSSGYALDTIKFSAFMQTGASAVINWGYSLDGINVISTGVQTSITGSVPVAYTADLSAFSGVVSGDSDLVIVAQFVGTNGNTLVFDNAQFIGTQVIPEPSTYAALLGAATIGFVLLRRRKTAVL